MIPVQVSHTQIHLIFPILKNVNKIIGPPILPTNMIGIYTDTGDVTLSWLKQIDNTNCNVTYLLRYRVDGGPELQINTRQTEHTIVNPPLCSDILVRLWTISDIDDNISDRFLSFNYTGKLE